MTTETPARKLAIPRVLAPLVRPIELPERVRTFLGKFVIPAEEKRRLVSVDALRAIAVMGMLLVNDHAAAGHSPEQLIHVEWEGLRFADMVFPWFLFVVGVAMALSFGKRSSRPWWAIWGKFASRVIALIAIGLVLNFYKYGEPLRYMGVLQRIALASLLAAPWARRKPIWPLLAAALALLAHTWILLQATAPGVVPGSFGAENSIAYWLDVRVLGEHLYKGGFEPEGLLGVISSAGQVLLGIAAGRWLLDHPRSGRGMFWVAAGGFATLLAGLAIEPYIPMIKNLWTSSYVLVTSGLGALLLVALYFVGDYLRGERLIAWLEPPGRNALLLYIGSTALFIWMNHFQVMPAGAEKATTLHIFLSQASVTAFGPMTGAIVYSSAHLLFWYAVAAVLDKARLYVRL